MVVAILWFIVKGVPVRALLYSCLCFVLYLLVSYSKQSSPEADSVSGLELGEEGVDVDFFWLGLANLPVGGVDVLLCKCFWNDQVDLLQLDASVGLSKGGNS